MRLVFPCILLWLASATAWSVERRLESIELRSDGEKTSLEFLTDAPANFTSFKLSAPPRVVVDFPDMVARGRTRQTFSTGLVRGWTFERLGDERSPLVRVFVELRENADYTIAADGARIHLTLEPTKTRALASLETDSEAPSAVSETTEEPLAPSVAAVEPRTRSLPDMPKPSEALKRSAPHSVAPALERPEERPEAITARAQSTLAREPDSAPRARRPVVEPAPSPRASLERVSFRPIPGGALVVIRTSEPVAWALVEASPRELQVELEGTLIRAATNRLPLDTRFFGTPVGRVTPKDTDVGDETRIVVTLSEPSRWSAFATGNEIVVEVVALRSAPPVAVGGAF